MKPRLSFEEHVEMGRALASMRDEVQKRWIQLENAYPRSGQQGVPAKKLEAAFNALETARTELDHLMFQEHPEEGTTKVYYPDAEDRIRFR
ncbi:hypothetical protein J7E93_07370 [Streptomyces sp. ISL-36]|uniref:hypothetical protein n=1 Tax=Streptomyces sp. ISL-36 TaxID=2819182 RepID=UPI001BECD943|nr:hypothetical protein [Streptomyces sp. ISL-36]MBT2439943.1 hypothetical protein [Streptomyces sp. ISL-36]